MPASEQSTPDATRGAATPGTPSRPFSQADLHLHSKYSDRPSEWILRRIGAPESFVEPLELYQRCRSRGMDYVTITDHNCIRGCLDIAHLPGVFLSSEVTTYFPEDRAKIHVLVWGLDGKHFDEIQDARENIYDLQQLLHNEDIPHAVAHPLFRVNDRLTVEQFERLVLLFKRFEVINGCRHQRAEEILKALLGGLTPEFLEELANRHNIEPVGPRPWEKWFVGGSDDHSGLYEAVAYTTTPPANSVEEFLGHLRQGQHAPAGNSGSSLQLAHSLYHIAYEFYKSRFMSDRRDLLGELFRRMMEGPRTNPPTLTETVLGFARRVIGSYHLASMRPAERVLVEECMELFAQHQEEFGPEARRLDPAGEPLPAPADDERNFHLACQISDKLGYAFFREFLKYLQQGKLLETLQTFLSLGPVALSIAPYLAAFRSQHKDEAFCQQVASRFPSARHLEKRSARKAWITDTFTDLNGVTRTIRTVSSLAKQEARDLTVVTCLDEMPDSDGAAGEVDFPLKNFVPIGTTTLPEYDSQMLACPPVLEVIEYLEKERFCELIISTPGPLGLTALAAGKLLGLKMTGIYHTDFPRYVGRLTDDRSLEQMTWRYMLWFYGQMNVVFAPSEAYRRDLIDQGLDGNTVKIMRRGVDPEQFGPQFRDPTFWSQWDLPAEGFKFLYVGRISKEKNLELLVQTFLSLPQQPSKQLILVGDGPLLADLKRRFAADGRVLFPGVLRGRQLATAYASADAFVFPSTTDTFGNAVLEAQASGLPAIVSDVGGPQEIVGRFESGLVVPVHQPGRLAETMLRLSQDTDLQQTLRQKARLNAAACTWRKALDALWFGAEAEPAPESQNGQPPHRPADHLAEVS